MSIGTELDQPCMFCSHEVVKDSHISVLCFVKVTFQLNLSRSFSLQVILSSMIKECEIKVENRGMADAQG